MCETEKCSSTFAPMPAGTSEERGNGKQYNSKSGMAAIIGLRTQKCVAVKVYSMFETPTEELTMECTICGHFGHRDNKNLRCPRHAIFANLGGERDGEPHSQISLKNPVD